MEEEKYYLVLTGELSEGQNREAAESDLGRLLRISSEKAGSLLRGKPSRIHKGLAGEKAKHLLEKVLACGVGCRLETASSEQASASSAKRVAPGMRGRPLGRRLKTQGETTSEPSSVAELSGAKETDLTPAMGTGMVNSGSDMAEQSPESDHSLELEFIEQEPAGAGETPVDQTTEPEASRETPESTQDSPAELSLEWEAMSEAQEKPAEDKPVDEVSESEQESPAIPLELKLVEPEQAEAGPRADELTLDPESPRKDERVTDPASTDLSLDLELDVADPRTAEQDREVLPGDEEKGSGGIAAAMSNIVLESPAPVEQRTRTQPLEEAVRVEAPQTAQFFGQPERSEPRKSRADKKAPSGLDRKRTILAGVLVLVVLVAGAWMGVGLFSSGDNKTAASGKEVSTSAEQEVQPKGPAAVTKIQQNLLARSVKIWMIQYGAGFDPGQVTLAGLEQDLHVPPGELQDGWGTTFRYEPRTDRYLIISAGPDRQFDTADDLSKQFIVDTGGK